jgi:hypothetical protein
MFPRWLVNLFQGILRPPSSAMKMRKQSDAIEFSSQAEFLVIELRTSNTVEFWNRKKQIDLFLLAIRFSIPIPRWLWTFLSYVLALHASVSVVFHFFPKRSQRNVSRWTDLQVIWKQQIDAPLPQDIEEILREHLFKNHIWCRRRNECVWTLDLERASWPICTAQWFHPFVEFFCRFTFFKRVGSVGWPADPLI